MEGTMNKVAIFGNAGGGKSTLAKQLAEATGLPLHSLDKLQYRPGGEKIPHEQYLNNHRQLLEQPQWIIDGFGCKKSAWQRFAQADTLIHLDLSLPRHAWWITKRCLQGLVINPEGWPDNSPIWRSTYTSYRVLWLCHKHLTPAYRQLLIDNQHSKTIYHLRSPADIRTLVDNIRRRHPFG